MRAVSVDKWLNNRKTLNQRKSAETVKSAETIKKRWNKENAETKKEGRAPVWYILNDSYLYFFLKQIFGDEDIVLHSDRTQKEI